MVRESALGNLKEYVYKHVDVRKRIFFGELFPWYLFVVIGLFFADMTYFDFTGDYEVLWCVQFLFFSCVVFLLLYGRALCRRTSIVWGGLISLSCFVMVGFAVMYFHIIQLMMGILAIAMGVCVMVCANSWLFRFRGGRIIGLLMVFVAASILYNKLGLEFEKYPYAREPVIEPFHIANQLVGVVLPVRGKFNDGVSTIKPLLYEGCHFFIWLFLISLAVSFANRELINRLYLKLTQFKPLYVFWSNTGSSEEETVAEDILKRSVLKLFKPNVVLALWGKDKENSADVCDKWKRGRRWIEASSAEYDDIASHANVHYILSSDGNANLVKCMELMRHVKRGTIYVKTDGAADSYVDNFRAYVKSKLKADENAKRSIRIFSEVGLLNDEMSKMKEAWSSGRDKVFLVNYFSGLKPSGPVEEKLSRIELAATAGFAKRLGIPAWQVVGSLSQKLDHAEYVVFCCKDPRFQMMAIADYYAQRKNANTKVKVYAYAKSMWLVDLLQKCYGGLTIFGSEQSLFTQSSIKQATDDRKSKGGRT